MGEAGSGKPPFLLGERGSQSGLSRNASVVSVSESVESPWRMGGPQGESGKALDQPANPPGERGALENEPAVAQDDAVVPPFGKGDPESRSALSQTRTGKPPR